MPVTSELPIQHLSVRVPWHDAQWDGSICRDVKANSACLRLHNIFERRDDEFELANSGTLVDAVDPGSLPPASRSEVGSWHRSPSPVS